LHNNLQYMHLCKSFESTRVLQIFSIFIYYLIKFIKIMTDRYNIDIEKNITDPFKSRCPEENSLRT